MSQTTRARMTRQELGRWGEELAVRYLTEVGMTVLERNWRCRDGELDAIAFDPLDRTLVAVEVKTRRSVAFGSPLEAVTPAKAARLRRLLLAWTRDSGQRAHLLRVDVIGVLRREGAPAEVQHVRGVGQ